MAGGKIKDKAIKNAKPGERLAILADGGGLQLWLTTTGGKLWNYAYRFGGKRKRLAIGPYGKDPAGVPLEAARKRRDEAAGLLRDGGRIAGQEEAGRGRHCHRQQAGMAVGPRQGR